MRLAFRRNVLHLSAVSVLSLMCATAAYAAAAGSPGRSSIVASAAQSGGSAVDAGAAPSSAQVLTYHNDNLRSGQNTRETRLTTANVNSANFGLVGLLTLDGKVDGEPLYAAGVKIQGATHNILYVVTEHDSVYAFDADTGAVLWHVSALGSNETPSDARNCGQVVPEIGITSTPVIDPSAPPHGAIYVVAMSKDSSGNYHHRLHALDLISGAELAHSPVTVQATFPSTGPQSSNGHIVFDPKQYKERAGLLLLNGTVYLSWSSHCDYGPYTAWVMGYDEKSLAQTSVLDLTPNGNDGSIWQSGAGPAADSNGNIYFLMANGTFDTALNASGFPSHGDYGNAFMKLSTAGNKLAVADYFNMSNTVAESNSDEDLGSGGALLLPDINIAGTVSHFAVGTGKDQSIYIVNRDKMGKFSPNRNNIAAQLPNGLGGQEFGMAAYWNNTVYYGAAGDFIRAFSLSGARATLSSHNFPYPGATPSISSNGTSNGILWAIDEGSPAVLYAYDATNLNHVLYTSNQAANGRDQFGAGNKFITPMIVNGKVYVGTQTGVAIFGLLH